MLGFVLNFLKIHQENFFFHSFNFVLLIIWFFLFLYKEIPRKYIFVMFSLSLSYCSAFSLFVSMIYAIWVNPGLGQSHNKLSFIWWVQSHHWSCLLGQLSLSCQPPTFPEFSDLDPVPLWINDSLNRALLLKQNVMYYNDSENNQKIQGVCTK